MVAPVNETIRVRLRNYDEDHPTAAAKRALATNLITRDAELPAYDELRMVRFQLSVLWAHEKGPRVQAVARHLWRMLPVATDFANQAAIVFHYGNEQSPQTLRDNGYMSLTAGILPAKPEFEHTFTGKLSSAAKPSVDGIRAPYICGTTFLPLLQSRRVTIAANDVQISEPTPGETPVPVYGAAAHIGEDQRYSANSAITDMYPVALGNGAVREFLTRLVASIDTDIPVLELLPSAA